MVRRIGRQTCAAALAIALWGTAAGAEQFGVGTGPSYPAALDRVRAVSNAGSLPCSSSGSRICAELINDIQRAIVAVETALGVQPMGAAADVAARLQALDAVRHDPVTLGTGANGLSLAGQVLSLTTASASASGALSAADWSAFAAKATLGVANTWPAPQTFAIDIPVPLGSELVTNGTFTGSATGWTLQSGCSVYTNNHVVATLDAGCQADAYWPSVSTTFPVVAGTSYLVTFTVSSANAPMMASLDTSPNDALIPYGNGTHTMTFTATFTGTETISFDDWKYDTGDTYTLDDVSIKATNPILPALTVRGYDGTTWLSLGGDVLGNTALGGGGTLSSNTTGFANSAVGYAALSSNTTGRANTALGHLALSSNTTGMGNTALGGGTLSSNTTGGANTALGWNALYSNTTGGTNIALGPAALYSNTTGSGNTALGYAAGWLLNESSGASNISGSDSVFLGAQTHPLADGQTNQIVIGAHATGAGSNTVTLGNASIVTTVLRGNVTTPGANGQNYTFGHKTELTTIGQSASTVTTMTIPANAILKAVEMRVTVQPPGTSTMVVTATTSGTVLQQGASMSTAAGTTDVGTRAWGTNYVGVAAQTITITPNVTPSNATGRVRIDLYYDMPTAATS